MSISHFSMKLLRFFAVLLLLTAAFGQLNRLFLGGGDNVVLYANDLVMGVVAVWYICYALIVRYSWRIPPVMVVLLAWCVVGLLGIWLGLTTLTHQQALVSFFYWIRYVSYLGLFFIAYDSVVYARDHLQAERTAGWWMAWLLMAGVLMAVGGFIQLYILPDLTALAKYGWDPHIGRLVTAMLDPNYAGCYLSIGIGIAISLFLYLRRQWAVQSGLLIVAAVMLLALLLTYSRSGYLMLAGVIAVISVLKSRWLVAVGIVLALLAVLLVPRVQQRLIGAISVDASAQPRIISWQNSLEIASHNWFLGTGFNSYRYAQDRYGILDLENSGNSGAGADSSWLFVLATTGIVGFGLFVIQYLAMAWISFRVYRRGLTALTQAIGLASLAILVGLAVSSQFNNALFYTWILEPLWILMGVLFGLQARSADPATSIEL